MFITANACVVLITCQAPTCARQTLFLTLLSALTQLDNVVTHVNSGGYYYYHCHFIDEETESSVTRLKSQSQ